MRIVGEVVFLIDSYIFLGLFLLVVFGFEYFVFLRKVKSLVYC